MSKDSSGAYLISSVEDLNTLSAYVNDKHYCEGLTFKQTQDIFFDEVADGQSNFTPIGNSSNKFAGTYDGGNFKIYNLAINNPSWGNQGLFGCVFQYGTIKDVHLVNANISGDDWVGGLVGQNWGGTVTEAYALTLPKGITASEDNVVKVSGNIVYIGTENSEVTLTLSSNVLELANMCKITGITDATANNDGTYTYNATGNATLKYLGFPKITGLTFVDGDSGQEYYKIATLTDLQTLADYVNNGGDTTGLTFKITANISGVDCHIGTSSNKFKGILDGCGKTITVSYNSTTENCALFNYVDGATIKKLTVNGSITTSAKYAAGIAAHTYGTTNITDCISSVTITSTVSGDGIHGGFVGIVDGGTVSGNDYVGGLVGFNQGTVSGSSSGVEVCGTGDNVGGLVGENRGTVSESLVDDVTVTSSSNDVGSFVGFNSTYCKVSGYYHNITEFTGAGDATEVFLINLPENVTATGTLNFGKKYYAAADTTITLNAAEGYTRGNITVNGTPDDDGVFTVDSDTNITADVTAIVEEEDLNEFNATFTATIVYGDDNDVIVLNNINKKPTKTGSSQIYQKNDIAAATLKIWDTSGSKQAVLSAAKLKKLFKDYDYLSDEQQAQVTRLSELVQPANIITTSGGESTFTNPLTTPLALNSNKPKD